MPSKSSDLAYVIAMQHNYNEYVYQAVMINLLHVSATSSSPSTKIHAEANVKECWTSQRSRPNPSLIREDEACKQHSERHRASLESKLFAISSIPEAGVEALPYPFLGFGSM